MAIGNIDPQLWERFAQANRQKGLTMHATLEKLIAVWLDVYAEEEFGIPREPFERLHDPEKPDYLNQCESKKPVNRKLKEIRR